MRKIFRRLFIKCSATALGATVAAPYIITSSTLGRNGSVTPRPTK